MIGDLVFVSYVSPNFIERAIKFFQGLDYPATAEWEHVAICIDDNFNEICEAVSSGVRISKFSEYGAQKIKVLTAIEKITEEQKAEIVRGARAQVEKFYNFGDIFFLGLRLIAERFHSPIRPSEPITFDSEICSEMVINVLRWGDADFLKGREARNVSPAELMGLVEPPLT